MPPAPTSNLARLCKKLPPLEPVRHSSLRSMATAQPFNFMGLPTELRLMVYERIPCHVRHTRISLPSNEENPEPLIVLITRTCSTAILRTSRTVYHEAKSVVSKVTNKWIEQQPLRFISSRGVALDVVDKIVEEALESVPPMNDVFKRKFFMPATFRQDSDKPHVDFLNEKFAYVCGVDSDSDSDSDACLVLKDLFKTAILRSGLFQFMAQALRASANGSAVRREMVFVPSALSTDSDRLEQSRAWQELAWSQSIQGRLSGEPFEIQLAGVLSTKDAEHITRETAKSLKPALDMLKQGSSAQTVEYPEVMAQHIWEENWVATE
ncbi:hypothetical protein BDU57DRAFT_333863 [Ampelomyces quisqualis]|uniref:F-box domain-containing protein n=1 Tax=Ampelomyces quisqualis TaxID=50730 RepID=A0A6A5QBN2_AMPQU|nr:hypothetical protein BDU57DRAFT_333863 [Ampelomyces quisqualis]